MAQSWRETKGRQPAEKKPVNKSIGSCFGCLGIAFAAFAMLGVATAATASLLRRGIEVNLGRHAAMLDTLAGRLGQQLLPVCIAAVFIGLALMYITTRPSIKEFNQNMAAIQASASSFEQGLAARYRRSKRIAGVMVSVGILLFLTPLLAPLLATLGPVLPGSAYGFIINLLLLLCGAGVLLIVASAVVLVSPTIRLRNRELPREQVVYEELQTLFSDVLYYPQGNLDPAQVYGVGLLPQGNTFKDNDCIRASYHGVSFSQADISCSLKEQVRSRGTHRHATRTTVRWQFSGRWLTLHGMKHTSAPVYIYSKNFPALNVLGIHRGLERIEVEDLSFNNAFDIYAQHGQDAFFVLTPRIIDKLKTLAGISDNHEMRQGVAMACVGGEYHLAVSGVRDAFEFLFAGAVNEEQVRERVRRDMALIPDLIDTVL